MVTFGQRNPCRSLSSVEDGSASGFQIEQVIASHHSRREIEEFIASSFRDAYGAEIQHFCNTLVGCRNFHGALVAALGFSYARDGSLFLEQYLDAPIESEIARRAGVDVHREQVVEVGNLAATHIGAARSLIRCMTDYLHDQGLTWVAFTATRNLLNSFTRLRLKPGVLADADPRRLPDGGKSWGGYYTTAPQVMFGNIQQGHAQLSA